MSSSAIESAKRETGRRKRRTSRVNMGRDERMYTSMYIGEVLTTEHIARMYFPSQAYLRDPNTEKPHFSTHAAEERLYKLRREGYVLNQSLRLKPEQSPTMYWWLTQKRYKREAKAFGRRDERQEDLPKRLAHHLKTNDIYARIHPRFEQLFSELDPEYYPDWQWKNERHSHCNYHYEGRDSVHQPDAELHLPDGRAFFIERQTEDSRKSESAFRDKAGRCRNYIRWRGFEKGTAKIMFACDTERDENYARKVCKEVGIGGVVGSPEKMVNYLLKRAEEVG